MEEKTTELSTEMQVLAASDSTKMQETMAVAAGDQEAVCASLDELLAAFIGQDVLMCPQMVRAHQPR